MEQQILNYIGSLMIAVFVAIFPAGCMCIPMDNPEFKNSKFAKIWNIIVYLAWVIAVWYFFNFSESGKILFDKDEFTGIGCFGLIALVLVITLKPKKR